MISLSRVESRKRLQRRRDRARPAPGFIDHIDHLLGRRLLFVIGVKNRRSVLRADVVALAVERGRIMQLEKQVEQFLERHFGRIVIDAHGFGVAGASGFHVLIGRIVELAAGVADLGVEHARHLPD